MTVRVLGFSLLVSYLVLTGDWRISIYWARAFPGIAFLVAGLTVSLKIPDRFPKLNHYFLYPKNKQDAVASLSNDEWALGQAKYLANGMKGASILFAPSEDGLICVPILMVGLGLIPSVLGGVAFGLLHLSRFTYFECLGKSVYYTLVCIFVLPHGLLTVALGHLLMDFIALIVLTFAKRSLSQKLRSVPEVK